jgi:hypothetical protein
MECSCATFLPLCDFQALIIGNVTGCGAQNRDFDNRMNVYDTEPRLRLQYSRYEPVGWEFFPLSKLALPRLHTCCEVIPLNPHGNSITFETHDTMYLKVSKTIQVILLFCFGV